jgi:hypothetical protein
LARAVSIAVVVGDPQVAGGDVGEQAERAACGLRRRSAAHDHDAVVPCLGPANELVDEPALADACLADDADDRERRLARDRGEGVLQRLELVGAADHRRRRAFDAARRPASQRRQLAHDEVAAQRCVDALDLQWRPAPRRRTPRARALACRG